jgi:hypothetical protein
VSEAVASGLAFDLRARRGLIVSGASGVPWSAVPALVAPVLVPDPVPALVAPALVAPALVAPVPVGAAPDGVVPVAELEALLPVGDVLVTSVPLPVPLAAVLVRAVLPVAGMGAAVLGVPVLGVPVRLGGCCVTQPAYGWRAASPVPWSP